MVNAQEWLDKEYPKADREYITNLDISSEELKKKGKLGDDEILEGFLNLEDFVNLKLLDCSWNKITSLDISNCNKLEKLDCSYNKLRDLNLNQNSQLIILNCCFNQLIDLDLAGLTELRMLHCSDNFIEKLNYLDLDPAKLVYLNISDNNLPERDLSVFNHFTNLEELILGNFEVDKIRSSVYNRFYGSLESLKDLTKLKSIFIKNTNIDTGLECLPSTVETVYCWADTEFNFKVKAIEEALKGYGVGEEEAKKREENNSGWFKNLFKNKKDKERKAIEELAVKEFLREEGYSGYYDFQAWRKNNLDLVTKAQDSRINELRRELAQVKTENTELKDRYELVKSELDKIWTRIEGNTRNIILIGRTGNGKSTLGNVLVNKDDQFKEIFKESASGVSETKNMQSEEFELNGIKYRIVDTIGIGDTMLTEKEVLDRIIEATHSVRHGLSQVLFVTNGRFSKAEVTAYNLLRGSIFDENITKYTTIVRTGFSDFQNNERCEEDRKKMINESDELAEIINSCNKVIHVENPPATGIYADLSKKVREISRKKILDHLEVCQEIYEPQNLKEFVAKTGESIGKKEVLQQKIIDIDKVIDQKKLELKELKGDGEIEKIMRESLIEEIRKLDERRRIYEAEVASLAESIRQAVIKHMGEKWKRFARKIVKPVNQLTAMIIKRDICRTQ